MNMKILHVDDDQDYLTLAKKWLEKEDSRLQVESAMSAEEALKLLKENHYDIVVSDYAMPGLNGIVFLEKIRKNSDIPFILFTGKGREEVAMKALNLGANRYLRKSYDVATQYRMLAEAIVQQVKLHESQKELKKSQERLQLALKATRAGWWDWDLQTDRVVYNERYAEMIGFDLEELQPATSDTWRERIHPDDEGRSDRLWAKHLAGETDIYECECRVKHKNGEWVWVLDRGQAVEWDQNGNPTRVTGTHIDITERKRAEEALRRKSEEQALLLDSIPTQIWYLKDTETYGAVNKAHAQFVGKPKEALENHKLDDFLSEQEAKICRIGNREVFETKQRIHTEEWLVNEEGDKRLIAITKTPNLDEEGNVEFVVCAGHDITGRKITEETLKRSEEKYRTLLSSIEDIIFVYDEENCYTDCFTSDDSLLCVPAEEFMGKHVEDVLPTDIANLYVEHLNRVRKSSQPSTFDYKMTIDGSMYWFSARMSLHENGRSVVTVVREITERKKAENTLMLQSQVLNSIRDRVVATDLSGKITYANEAVTDMLDISLEELVGHSVDILGENPERGATQKEIVELTLRDGEWEGEVVNYTAHGEERLLHSRIQVLRDESDKPIGMVGISRDITEKKRAEQRKEVLHHLLSHDVGNKSHIIQSGLAILQHTNLSHEQANIIKRVINAIKEQVDIVEKIRILSSIDSEELTDVPIQPIVSDISEQKEGLANEKNIRIETEMAQRILKAKAGLLLKSLMINLVENAIEHSEGSLIRISCEEHDERIRLSVEDNGIGIPEEIKQRVAGGHFDDKLARKEGLGLYLAKWIAETYHGHIEMGDSNLGGAAVNVYLRKAD